MVSGNEYQNSPKIGISKISIYLSKRSPESL